jgi:homoserine O-acetyltransferase/O-succinyltransferase
MEYFNYNKEFWLESGKSIPTLTIAYNTYGALNKSKSNVVWICHALTSNSEVTSWWPGLVGSGQVINPEEHYIVCANILGSCYGTTGPLSINPKTLAAYGTEFPLITIRDMVRAHILLKEHLGLTSINILMGGSMGGYQALEWSIIENNHIQNLILMATSAAESAWGIAIHTAQRMAIEADPSWIEPHTFSGLEGLKAARAIGILTYRNYQILKEKQTDPDTQKIDGFKSSAYIKYQGEKLASRFSALSYWNITKSMDSHQLARGRNSTLEELLQSVFQKTMVVAITSDLLCPVNEQVFIAQHLPNSTFIEIDSAYGHDGFLVEAEKISKHIKEWLSN